MKKLLVSLLLLTFLITACGGSSSPASETKDTENTTDLAIVSFEPDEDFEFSVNSFSGSLKLSIPEKDENGSGKICLEYKPSDSDDEVISELPYVEWLTTSYVFSSNDELYVLIQGCFSNDWRNSYLLKYYDDPKAFTLEAEYEGGINNNDDITADGINIYSRADIFGTYSTKIKRDYYGNPLSDYYEFMNEPTEGFWDDFDSSDTESLEYLKNIYSDDGRSILTLISGIEGLDENENPVEIPSGSVIYPTGYSPEERIFYFEYEGTPLHFYYTDPTDSNSYGHDIGGVNEENIFAIMPYAG